MRSSESEPRALGGGPLAEGNFVRLIYTDEAGTSAQEPVCVVAAIIVHGDSQWRLLQGEMERIVREKVPEHLQPGFVIHATEIFSGGNNINREEWPFESRVDFLKEIVSLPFVHDVPISIGTEYKEASRQIIERRFGHTKGANALSHLIAFTDAMERADYFLRKYLNGQEIGTVVAEDIDRMRQFLAEFGLMYRDSPTRYEPEMLRMTTAQIEWGIKPTAVERRIDHIIDVPHFVKKGKAPLLQLADVCAFAFRRCLTGKSHGADLVCAMLGPIHGKAFLDNELWFSAPGSASLFNVDSYLTEDQRGEQLERNLHLVVQRILRTDKTRRN